ncbi:MAG: iron ABC transporter permease, partial [Bacteroidota bacterium]
MQWKPRHRMGAGLIMLLLLGLTLGGGLFVGSYDLGRAEVWEILLDRNHPQAVILWDLRIPRLLLAFLSGCVLTLGGYFMQALIKNPLADPYIMGLTAGAGFGVNLLVLGLLPMFGIGALAWATPLAAGIGGLGSLLLVMGLGWRSMYEDSSRLLIAGVAAASIFTALTGILIYLKADSDQIRQIVFWSFGSFHRANWLAVHLSIILALLTVIFGFTQARKLDLLALGDIHAQTLGLRVTRFKILLLVFTSLSVGGTVAFTGPIGFVGMMIPHFSRAIWGGLHRPNVVLGSLLGGTYLLA